MKPKSLILTSLISAGMFLGSPAGPDHDDREDCVKTIFAQTNSAYTVSQPAPIFHDRDYFQHYADSVHQTSEFPSNKMGILLIEGSEMKSEDTDKWAYLVSLREKALLTSIHNFKDNPIVVVGNPKDGVESLLSISDGIDQLSDKVTDEIVIITMAHGLSKLMPVGGENNLSQGVCMEDGNVILSDKKNPSTKNLYKAIRISLADKKLKTTILHTPCNGTAGIDAFLDFPQDTKIMIYSGANSSTYSNRYIHNLKKPTQKDETWPSNSDNLIVSAFMGANTEKTTKRNYPRLLVIDEVPSDTIEITDIEPRRAFYFNGSGKIAYPYGDVETFKEKNVSPEDLLESFQELTKITLTEKQTQQAIEDYQVIKSPEDLEILPIDNRNTLEAMFVSYSLQNKHMMKSVLTHVVENKWMMYDARSDTSIKTAQVADINGNTRRPE